jgi:hypothetical protein
MSFKVLFFVILFVINVHNDYHPSDTEESVIFYFIFIHKLIEMNRFIIVPERLIHSVIFWRSLKILLMYNDINLKKNKLCYEKNVFEEQ